MILMFAFACRVNTGHAGSLIVPIDPDAAHGVMHRRKNLHWFLARINAEKLFVNFENAFELAVERFAGDVSYVQIHRGFAANTEAFLIHDTVNGACGDITRNEIAILGIPLFEEIEALAVGNCARGTLVARILRHPNASTLAARRLAHQAKLVFARDGGRMNLNELTVGVVNALLEK